MKILTIYFRYWSIRIFFLSLLALIAFGAYFYSVPQLTLFNHIIINPLYTDVEKIPTWLYVVDYFIFIFSLSILIIFLMILYYNANKKIEERIDNQYVDGFVRKIFLFLYPLEEFTNKQKKYQLKEIKKDLSNDHAKQLFINLLRRIHAQTSGLVKHKVEYFMKEIDYNYFIAAYLHSPYLRDKLFALKVIGDFEIEGFEQYILKQTKRRNEVLHSESIITLLKLKIYDNLLFLSELNMKLTTWDINIIVKAIMELNIVNIDYLTLINSETSEISALGIMLAKLKNRKEFKHDIKKKVGNLDKLVNEEAFLAFCFFADNKSDYDYLIKNFGKATEKSQLTIIYKIASIQDTELSGEFLNYVVENQNFVQKIEAIKLLLDIDLNVVSKYKQSKDEVVKQSYYQVLDINL